MCSRKTTAVGRLGEKEKVWQFVRRLQHSVQLHIVTAPTGVAAQEMEKRRHEYERLQLHNR